MKPKDQRCPGVLEMIATARELLGRGKCHCPCVNDDIPKAEQLSAEGKCLGAAKVIKAALARCDDPSTLGSSSGPLNFTPIQPWLPGGE